VSAPGWLVLAFLGLVTSAQTRLTLTVVGMPVSVPVLGIIALAVVLALAAAVLVLLRLLVRDGLNLRPRMVPT
jgi:hypothetical protein